MSIDYEERSPIICGAQIAEDQYERELEKEPIRQLFEDRIRKDLEKYPYLPNDMKEFTLEYVISFLTDVLSRGEK